MGSDDEGIWGRDLGTLPNIRVGASLERLLTRIAPWVRRETSRFLELERLRGGFVARRIRRLDLWFPPRQFLIRSPGRTVALPVAPRLQIAIAVLSALGLLGYFVTVAVAAWGHHAASQMAQEMEQLRSTARVETEHAAEDRQLLRRLGQELMQSFVDRDRATEAAFADRQSMSEGKSIIERLIAEREAAIGRAVAERVRIGEERDRAVAERDKALAERDAAITANREVLGQLDARTQSTIAEVERIIASTGLDLARVIKVPVKESRNAPRGGPFVPWPAGPAPDGTAEARRLLGVASGLDRLQALRSLLAHLPLASPIAHVEISSGFGFRLDPFSGFAALHEGIDLSGPANSPIYSTAAGTVSYAGWKSEYGNVVEIDHGFGIATRYAHLGRINVKTGEPVRLHQQLGLIGTTGRTTGVHLHYEVRVDGQARNPVKFLKADRYVPEAGHHVPQEIPAAADQFYGFDLH